MPCVDEQRLSVDFPSSSDDANDDAQYNLNIASISEIDERDYASHTEDEATEDEEGTYYHDVNHTDTADSHTRGRYYDESFSRSFASEVTEHASPHKRKPMLSPKRKTNKLPPKHHIDPPSSRILANHQRVPGGAAAKLIGRKDKSEDDDDYQFVNDGDDALEVVAPVDELIKSRDMAKAEFSMGSTENKRYHAPVVEHKMQLNGKEGLPRILDRDKVFHESVAAAIVSILTPAKKSRVVTNAPELDKVLTARSSEIQLSSTSSSRRSVKTMAGASTAFQISAKKNDGPDMKGAGNDVNSAVVETMTSTGRNPLVQNLITKKTELHLATIKNRMKDPTRSLTELMEAIASPKDGLFDRHYMVRRKNACGALKVLAANASHRVNICWTLGVLPALSSVLEDCGPDTLEDHFPNPTIRREYIEARKRAVSALVYLATPKNNKLPIFHCPRLVASLIRVIEQDDGEARRGCCAVLAHLSKSKENRLIMAQIPGLLDAATAVIEPKEHFPGSDDEDSMSSGSDSDTSQRDIFDDVLAKEIERTISERSHEQVLSKDTVMTEDQAELSARYDEDPDVFLHGARQNMFALLGHVVKEKDNAYVLARHRYLVNTLVSIAKLQESLSQDLAIKLLAHLSRYRSNSKIFVFKMKDVVPTLVSATNSGNGDSRKYSCYALQNFSQDKPCRQKLASINDLLPAICRRVRSAKDPEEKLAALHTLKNLTDEPANLIPMTNTPECFATLMQVAHASDESVTEMMQYIGCDALATLSHWFRSIATSGQRIGMMQKHPESPLGKDELFIPSLRALTWEPWQ